MNPAPAACLPSAAGLQQSAVAPGGFCASNESVIRAASVDVIYGASRAKMHGTSYSEVFQYISPRLLLLRCTRATGADYLNGANSI